MTNTGWSAKLFRARPGREGERDSSPCPSRGSVVRSSSPLLTSLRLLHQSQERPLELTNHPPPTLQAPRRIRHSPPSTRPPLVTTSPSPPHSSHGEEHERQEDRPRDARLGLRGAAARLQVSRCLTRLADEVLIAHCHAELDLRATPLCTSGPRRSVSRPYGAGRGDSVEGDGS